MLRSSQNAEKTAVYSLPLAGQIEWEVTASIRHQEQFVGQFAIVLTRIPCVLLPFRGLL